LLNNLGTKLMERLLNLLAIEVSHSVSIGFRHLHLHLQEDSVQPNLVLGLLFSFLGRWVAYNRAFKVA